MPGGAIRKRFTLTGTEIVVCDMRPGFSEDGLACRLPRGEYEVSIESLPHGRVRGFSLVLAGSTPTTEAEKGVFSTDMARVGVFDRRTFLAAFGGDGEALAEWSERATGRRKPAWGGFLRHTKSGLEALYVNVGSDSRCSVRLLRSGKRTVGIRVVPQPSAAPADEPGSRHWTWVVVKCRGIADTWELCDDRDYEPELEDLLDDILSEVGAEGPDAPIASGLPRFRGVERMSVYSERRGENRKRLTFPPGYRLPRLGPRSTPRSVAEAVFRIFRSARTRS